LIAEVPIRRDLWVKSRLPVATGMQMQASEVSLLFKKLLSILLAAALIPGFSACSLMSGKNVAPQEELKISYYNVKYGDNWIKSLTEAYKKQHPNVKITLIGDSHLNSSIVYSLMSGTDEPDIAFVSQTNWELWANDGYLTDLTGLYNTVTDDGKSFKD
jgi:ABC-type glycerol-3-phosphate transport system substrate-binding protein